MTTQAYPSINDFAPSWADVAVTFTVDGGDALDMVDIAGIKWTRKTEVGKQRGASGGRVMARTTGQGDFEASITLYRSGLRKLETSLAKKAPSRGNQKRIGLVAFDILIQHSVPNDPEIYTTKIKGCRYLGESEDNKEGTDPDKVECTLDPIDIVRIVDGQEIAII